MARCSKDQLAERIVRNTTKEILLFKGEGLDKSNWIDSKVLGSSDAARRRKLLIALDKRRANQLVAAH